MSSSALSLSPLMLLPREVQPLGSGHVGLSQVTNDTCIGWGKTQHHLYIYPLVSSGGRSGLSLTRLSIPPMLNDTGRSQAQTWFLGTLNTATADHEPGLLLVSSDGDLFCWPKASKQVVPMLDSLHLRVNENERVVHVAKVADLVCLVGTSCGSLFMVRLSMEDSCLRVRSLYDGVESASAGGAYPSPGGGGGRNLGQLVGWLWRGSENQSGNEQPTSPNKRQKTSMGMVVDITVSHDENDVYVLFANGTVHRWTVAPNATYQLKWTCSNALSWIANRRNANQEDVRLFGLGWLKKEEWVVIAAESNVGVSLHQLRGVRNDSDKPYLGDGTVVFRYPSKAHRDHLKFRMHNGLGFAAYEEQSSTKSFKVACIPFPRSEGLEQTNEWESTQMDDVTTGWFDMTTFGSQVAVLTATCVLSVRVDAHAPASMKKSDQEKEEQQRPSSPKRIAASLISRVYGNGTSSSAGGSKSMYGNGLNESDAKRYFDRIFKSFIQEVGHGRDGLMVAKQDNQWNALLGTDPDILHESIRAVCEKELDRAPTPRWADQWGSKTSSNAGNGGSGNKSEGDHASFSPQLIHRHLFLKKGRFGTPNGILGLLERGGIKESLSLESSKLLLTYWEKLSACRKLCELQNKLGFSRLYDIMKEIVINRYEREGKITREETFMESLDHSGLSIFDYFYANVTKVEELVEKLAEFSSSLGSDTESIKKVNMMILAILDCTKSYTPGRGDEESDLPACLAHVRRETDIIWVDEDEIVDSMEKQIKTISDTLTKKMNLDSSAILYEQLYRLVDHFLGAQRRCGQGFVEQRTLQQYIDPFFNYQGDQSSKNGQALKERCFEYGQTLCEEYVYLQGLFNVCALKENTRQLKQYMDNAVSTEIHVDQAQSGRHLLMSLGHPLDLGFGHEWKMDKHTIASTSSSSGGNGKTIRWSFSCTTSDDRRKPRHYLSFDGSTWSMRESEEPSYAELFEMIPHGDAVTILGWDQVSTLKLDLASGKLESLKRVEEWRKLPHIIFENLMDQPYKILELVEDGTQDKVFEDFLTTRTGSTIDELSWMNHLRLGRYQDAGRLIKKNGKLDALAEMALFCTQ